MALALAVLALLAAMVLPNLSRSVLHHRMEATAWQVRDAASLARVRALHEPSPPGPPLPPDRERLWVYRVASVPGAVRILREPVLEVAGTRTLDGPAEVLQEVLCPDGVASSGALEFDRYGRAAADGAVTLQSPQETRTVRVRRGETEVTVE